MNYIVAKAREKEAQELAGIMQLLNHRNRRNETCLLPMTRLQHP